MSNTEKSSARDEILELEFFLKRNMEAHATAVEEVLRVQRLEYEKIREMLDSLPQHRDRELLEALHSRSKVVEEESQSWSVSTLFRAAGLAIVLASLFTWLSGSLNVSVPDNAVEILSGLIGVVVGIFGFRAPEHKSRKSP